MTTADGTERVREFARDFKSSRWPRQGEAELFEAFFGLDLPEVAQRLLRVMLEPPPPFEPIEQSPKSLRKAREFAAALPFVWAGFMSFAIGRAEEADDFANQNKDRYWRLMVLLVSAIVRFDRSRREWDRTGTTGRRSAVARRARRLGEAAAQLCFLSHEVEAPEVVEERFASLTARLDDHGIVNLLTTLPEAPLARPGPEHVRAFRRVFAAREPEAGWKQVLREDQNPFPRWISESVRREVDRKRRERPERPEAETLLEDRPAHGPFESLSAGPCLEVSEYSGRESAPKRSSRARVPTPLEQFADEARAARTRLSNLAQEQGIKPQRLYDARRRAKAKRKRFRHALTPV